MKYKPTSADRQAVEVLVSRGYTQQRIADVLEIDVKVLRANFAHELKCGATSQEAKILISLYREALAGNVSAARELSRMQDDDPTGNGKGRLSNKVLSDMNARTAHVGTSWADILPKDTLGDDDYSPLPKQKRRKGK